MKRLFNILILTLVATCVCLSADAKGKKSSYNGTVYYVIIGSYESLAEANKYLYACPDWMEGPVYKAKANGKTVYRISYGCYRQKKNAQKAVDRLKKSGYTSWIWPSKGLANCVQTGTYVNDQPYQLVPTD